MKLALLFSSFIGAALYASTSYACSPNNTLPSGGAMYHGNSLCSADGRVSLDFQTDGNVVMHVDGLPTWATNTSMTDGHEFRMQTDGNVVLANTSNSTALWTSGTYSPGAYLTLGNDANLYLWQPSTNSSPWMSATNGWTYSGYPYMRYYNGYTRCNIGVPTTAASGPINSCVAGTPSGWTMLMDANTYYLDQQIALHKPITFGTFGSTLGGGSGANTTPCFNVASNITSSAQAISDGQTWTGIPCAQLIAANNFNTVWGGVLFMSPPITGYSTVCDAYDASGNCTIYYHNLPTITPGNVTGIKVDHINIQGNYAGRFAAQPIPFGNKIWEQVNVIIRQCTNCSFNYSASSNSLFGGVSAAFVDYFQANYNQFYQEGNALEAKVAPYYTPRHGACINVDASALGAQINHNFLMNCVDTGFAFNAGGPASYYPTYSHDYAQVNSNRIFARGHQYMAQAIDLNLAQYAHAKGMQVIGNYIDCIDPTLANDAQCTTGVQVGVNVYNRGLGSPGTSAYGGYIFTGDGTDAMNISYNTIFGPSVAMDFQFDPVAGNYVYVASNAVYAGFDNYNGIGGFFLPMSCKQWQQTPVQNGQDWGCKTAANNAGVPWYAANAYFPAYEGVGVGLGWSILTTNYLVDATVNADGVLVTSLSTHAVFSGTIGSWWGGGPATVF